MHKPWEHLAHKKKKTTTIYVTGRTLVWWYRHYTNRKWMGRWECTNESEDMKWLICGSVDTRIVVIRLKSFVMEHYVGGRSLLSCLWRLMKETDTLVTLEFQVIHMDLVSSWNCTFFSNLLLYSAIGKYN